MDIILTIKRDYNDKITYEGHDIKMAEFLVGVAKANPKPDKGEF